MFVRILVPREKKHTRTDDVHIQRRHHRRSPTICEYTKSDIDSRRPPEVLRTGFGGPGLCTEGILNVFGAIRSERVVSILVHTC